MAARPTLWRPDRFSRRWLGALAGLMTVAHLVGLEAGLRWLQWRSEPAVAPVTMMTLAFDQVLNLQAPPAVPPRVANALPQPDGGVQPGVLQAVTRDPDQAAGDEARHEPRHEPPPVPERSEQSEPWADPLAEGAQVAQGGVDSQAAASSEASSSTTASEPVEEAMPSRALPSPPAPVFEWPPSTRLSYRLQGEYRGPVHGSAKVEWIHGPQGYQVLLEIKVGPEFAPFLQRRMVSEGQVGAQGLRPRRYVEETKVLAGAWRRAGVEFEGATVLLSQGERLPAEPGLQDTASQFVHLTWLFTTQPERLTASEPVVLPVALRHKVDRWTYDVMAQTQLQLPWGTVPAWHLQPRRESRTASGLSVESWYAPQLQYLPVRILIRQDEQTYIDLTLERLPEQARPTSPP